MNINVDIMEYIKDYIEELLDSFSDILIYEKQYDYYVDGVAMILNPDTINVFLYSENLAAARRFLTDAGLEITTCSQSQEKYTAHYKNMLHVRVTNNPDLYKEKKSRNSKLESISLSNIVKSLKDKGFAEVVLIDKLLEIAEHK